MRILALDERLGRIGLQIFLTIVRSHIHRTEDISMISMDSSLILDRTCCVIRLYPIVNLLEILSVTCLISHTPDDD